MTYKTREEEVRATIPKNEAIRLIEEVYHAHYDPSFEPDFNVYDQLLACEAIAEATPIKPYYHAEEETKEGTNGNLNVNRIVNHSRKLEINFELTEDKLKIVSQLKACKYFTPPVEVAKLLEDFFQDPGTFPPHWLYIAQTYSQRVIYWNLNYMIKAYRLGFKTFQNWASYFTKTIKLRKKRKSLRLPMMAVKHKAYEKSI